jgi:serine/threonine protein kinase
VRAVVFEARTGSDCDAPEDLLELAVQPGQTPSGAVSFRHGVSSRAVPLKEIRDMTAALPFGRFTMEYLEKLGEGGLGRVDKVRMTASNCPTKPVGSEWACKRLNATWAAHPTMRERFEREIAALKQLKHPYIVKVEGENLPGGERYYLMPLYASTLRKYIESGRCRSDWRVVAKLGIQCALALQHAHGAGLVHRDIKPDNVLFNPGGTLVVADWGLGYFVHKLSKVLMPLTRGGMGTEYYCSFEQWSTGKCDHRGDIYSLGMTLDELLTGAHRQIVAAGFGLNGPSSTEGTTGAQCFNAVLQRMTAFSPEKRQASMGEVIQGLRAALVA